MVYCGKPSRGCQMCRTRRIKCDETKPTCNQCAKSRRQCPGYKDEFHLIFRNETKATERRVRKTGRKVSMPASGRASAAGQTPLSPSPSDGSISPVIKHVIKSPLEMAIIPALEVPVDYKASCHFVSNFILVPRQGTTRGFMDYLVPLLKAESPNGHLQRVFNACALASLGNRVSSDNVDFRGRAYAEYDKALKGITTALRDPEECKSDATLAAVLMLGMFENITAKVMGDFTWGAHVEGAIQIVKARGRKQLRTKVGLQLFIAVRTQLIIQSLTSGKAPIMGTEWWLNDAVKDEFAAECQRINLKTCELRAEVNRIMESVTQSPENVELVLALMQKAKQIDQQATSWMKSAPDQWQYRRLCWEDNVPDGDYSKAEVFPGPVDVYADFWIASVWNMVRTARLVLASVVVRCAAWVCSPVDYRTTPEYATASATCVQMISEVIASVPYHLGWHSEAKRRHLFDSDRMSGFACGEEDGMKGLAGYFLTWPLACIMNQDYVTEPQRQWAVGRLRYIGDELGIRYAHILSHLQIRFPSMLIRRDGMMAQPYPGGNNFVKLISAKMPPTPGYTMNPLQQREAMQKECFEKRKAELLAKASGGSSSPEETKNVAQKWLTV